MKLNTTSFFAVILIIPFLNAQTSSSITIDYTIDRGASNQVASGLLHGISATNPAQYLIDGITINAIRGADHHENLPSYFEQPTYNRAIATGAKLMIGLYYYRANDSYFPGDGGDFAKWQSICESVYNEAQTKNLDIYSWITWNEPRLQWGNSASDRNRYFQAHEVAYNTIKAMNPQARIQAPEDHSYNFTFMQEFLTYCKINNCLPDVLAWHELSQDPLNVESHCAELKIWMENNGITPMPMTVTEYQGSSYSNDNTSIPGVNVYYLASMERSVQHGFAFGLHACWTRSGSDTNFIATLADMADRDYAHLPRGLWWNYNTYSMMSGRQVGVTVNGANSDALASFDVNMKRSVVLIGTRNYFTPHDVSVSLDNIPGGLITNGKINIRVELITNEMVLTNPEVILNDDYEVTNGSVVLNLPQMAPKNAYAIFVTPATLDAVVISHEAENLELKDAYTSGTSHYVFNESLASGGSSTALESNAIGDFVEYTIPNPGAGVYNLSAILKGAANRAFIQLYIDGKATCPPEDLYKSSYQYYKNDFGNIEIGTEDLNLRFEVVGNHPNSTGYVMVFDRFDLKRLETASTASTHKVNFKSSLQVFPNPTSGSFTIDFDHRMEKETHVYLYDHIGRILLNKNNIKHGDTFNISKLPSGIYFIKVFNATQTYVKRISKK